MKRAIVLTQAGGFSGIDHDLIRHLSDRWEISVCRVPPTSRAQRAADIIGSFSWPMARWKRRFADRASRRPKSVGGFRQRTHCAGRMLAVADGECDVVFQISALFAPGGSRTAAPYVLYIDMTAAQACRVYPPWAPPERERDEWLGLEGDVYRGAARILTFNQAAADSVCRDYGLPADRVVTVGSGFDPSNRPAEVSQRNIDMLVVSNDFARHGGNAVLQTYREVRRRIPQARLEIVGVAVKEPGVTSHLRLARTALQKAYWRSSALINLGPVGGLQSALEGMACGCVPVALRANPHVGAIASQYGVALDDVRVERVASLLTRLLLDDHGLRQKSDACRSAAHEVYTWQAIVPRIDRALEEAASRRSDSVAERRPQRESAECT